MTNEENIYKAFGVEKARSQRNILEGPQGRFGGRPASRKKRRDQQEQRNRGQNVMFRRKYGVSPFDYEHENRWDDTAQRQGLGLGSLDRAGIRRKLKEEPTVGPEPKKDYDKQPKPKKKNTTTSESGAGGIAGYDPDFKSMQKAVISLQKFLDNDCGCEEDTLMQHSKGNPGKDKKGRAAYKDVQDKAERRQGGAYANKERDSEHRIEYPVGDTSEGGHLGGWGTGKENYEAEMKYLRRQGRGGTEGDYPEQRRATPPSESMRRGVLAGAKRTAKRKQDEANELPW